MLWQRWRCGRRGLGIGVHEETILDPARILKSLARDDGYALAEIRAACERAARLTVRGPGLIPHSIGQEERLSVGSEVGKGLADVEQEEHDRRESSVREFRSLPAVEQQKLIEEARVRHDPRRSSARPPLVEAVAVSLR